MEPPAYFHIRRKDNHNCVKPYCLNDADFDPDIYERVEGPMPDGSYFECPPMRYIRRKDKPTVVKAFGHVPAQGLGTFNTDIYELVEGELPEQYELEPSLSIRMGRAFDTLSPAARIQYMKNQLGLMSAFEDPELFDAYLDSLNLTQEEKAHVKKELDLD